MDLRIGRTVTPQVRSDYEVSTIRWKHRLTTSVELGVEIALLREHLEYFSGGREETTLIAPSRLTIIKR